MNRQQMRIWAHVHSLMESDDSTPLFLAQSWTGGWRHSWIDRDLWMPRRAVSWRAETQRHNVRWVEAAVAVEEAAAEAEAEAEAKAEASPPRRPAATL